MHSKGRVRSVKHGNESTSCGVDGATEFVCRLVVSALRLRLRILIMTSKSALKTLFCNNYAGGVAELGGDDFCSVRPSTISLLHGKSCGSYCLFIAARLSLSGRSSN